MDSRTLILFVTACKENVFDNTLGFQFVGNLYKVRRNLLDNSLLIKQQYQLSVRKFFG